MTVDLPAATLEAADSAGATVLRFSGLLNLSAVARLWNIALAAARTTPDRPLQIDLTALDRCDTAGATLLLAVEQARGGSIALIGANDAVTAVLNMLRPAAALMPPISPKAPPAWPIVVRTVLVAGLEVGVTGLAYLGEVMVALVRLPARRRMFRIGDMLRAADQTGVRAIPLVLLLGVLIGLILAFQSLVPMRRFGADIYVANLVALGLVRELGPLMAAVVLAGRSGSAFAAEIGTMKVNQELDALATMGLDTITMLVLPRLIAATIMMPVLTVIMEIAGLVGMTLVLTSSGIPGIVVIHQAAGALVPLDFIGGLVKACLFGGAIAAIGCKAGLNTGVGPRAVGFAATAAVVGGIVTTILLDGVLAIIFHRLNI